MILLDIFTFLGRLHPLVIHLPIGFILLAIIFNVVSYHKKYAYLRQAVSFTLVLGFISAIAASIFGYTLSITGDYDEVILNNHKISGLSLTLMAGLLYSLSHPSLKRLVSIPGPFFSVLSVLTLGLLGYVGHQGANLTHGETYLTLDVLQQKIRKKPESVGEALIFEDIVHPILEKRCFQCHERGKRKGQLSMTNLEELLKGGKHGPAVVAGNLQHSELFKRITLDPSDEDFMPSDGKTPLTQIETEVIRWWIEKGMAVQGKKISEITGHEEIGIIAGSVLGLNTHNDSGFSFLSTRKINSNIPDSIDINFLEGLRQSGLVVRLLLQDPVMLDVTLPPRSGRKMRDIQNHLERVAANIVWLNLSDNDFSDNDLRILGRMSNLEKLRIEKNPISDGVTDHLRELKYLEAVNLNETRLSDIGRRKLQENSAIKRIYTWKTLCTVN